MYFRFPLTRRNVGDLLCEQPTLPQSGNERTGLPADTGHWPLGYHPRENSHLAFRR